MAQFTVADALIKFGLDQAGLEGGLKSAERTADQGARRVGDILNKRIAEAASNLGKALSVALTAPILAIGTASVALAGRMEEAFAIIRRQTGATGQDMAALREDFRAVFRESPKGANEIAQALAAVNTRLGLTGPALRTATTSMLDFAEVAGGDAAENTREVTRLINAMGLTAAQLPAVLDTLTSASQRTGIGAAQLTALVTQSGPAFRALGFSLEQTIALLAQLEKAGADPAEVVQSLSTLFAKLAKGGVTDAAAAFRGFLQAVKAAPTDLAAAEIASDVFEKRGLQMARAIRSGAFELDGLTAALRTSQGTLQRSATESQTFGDKIAVLGHRLSDALGPLGGAILRIFDQALPTIQLFVGALTNLANAFAALPSGVQTALIAFGALLAAVGPLLLIIGKIPLAIAAVKAGMAVFSAAALTPVGAIALLAVGIGAATFAVYKLVQAYSDLRKAQADLATTTELANKAIRGTPQESAAAIAAIRERMRQRREAAGPPAERDATRKPPVDTSAADAAAFAKFLAKLREKAAGQNEALQFALKSLDLQIERERLSFAEQIAHLKAIRTAFARNADERLDLDIRIARLENQLATEEDARNDRARKIAQDRFEAESKAIDAVLGRLKEAADAGDVPLVVQLLDQWKDRLPDIAHGYVAIAEAAKKAKDDADAAAAAAQTGVSPTLAGAAGAIQVAQDRLEELATVRVRSVDLVKQEIVELQKIVDNERIREQLAEDLDTAQASRQARLRAERQIQDGLLEVERIRVDDARALLDLIQLQQSRGLATQADVDAARQRALAALEAQLAVAQSLNSTQAELVPILQQILALQQDAIRGDLLASLRQAITEVRAQTVDFLSVSRQVFADLTQGFANTLRSAATDGKTILDVLLGLGRNLFESVFNQVTNILAQQLQQRVAGILSSIIPGLAGATGAGPEVGLTAAGVSLSTAGIGLNTAGATLNVAAVQHQVAASMLQAAAAAFQAAGGGGFLNLIGGGMADGGIATRAMLRPIAERGPELVQPIPAGMNLREIGETVRRLDARGAGGPVTIQIINPTVRSDDDIRRIGRSVADAMRMARRGNHPHFREGR